MLRRALLVRTRPITVVIATEAYETVSAVRAGIASYFGFYNARRPHRAHDGQPPDTAYFESLSKNREAA